MISSEAEGRLDWGCREERGKWLRRAALQTLKVIGDRMTPAVSSLTMNLRPQRCQLNFAASDRSADDWTEDQGTGRSGVVHIRPAVRADLA